ncbi:MAG: trigger factor [Candidatus Izemoplasmatales bacterium]|uniref:Trigger factor n=1 Tax=Hujiaoplasma nucleasis TaxID=2725268 RepID=A0A7L6N318_9MOLU|nr:trigger factor [Hujiaoplasma nucleasis]QLY39608.1 trigger factor [Hujiaoplasma nucleasis]
MSIKIEKLEGSKVKFDVNVSSEKFEEGLDHAFKVENEKVEIKGFRKGKAPRKVFENKFGIEALYNEAIQYVLQETYYNAVVEHKIDVVAQPRIDLDPNIIKRGEDFTYGVTVAVKPEIELGEYKNLKISLAPTKVSDSEVNSEVEKKLNENAEMIVKESGEIEKGNTAVFDFKGSVDGVEFEGGSAENYELEIGSGQFIPGFEEQMLGMKAEEAKDVVVTFPEDYQQESLAGKEAVFAVKVHEIKERKVPELSDEFVKDLDIENIETVDAYKEHIRQNLEDQKEKQNQNHLRQSVIEKATENAKFDIPEEMIEDETNRMFKQQESQIKQYGLDFKTYLQYMNKTEEEFKDELKVQARINIAQQLIISEISLKEKIEASEEEVNAKYDELMEQYKSQNVSMEQIKQAIPQSSLEAEIIFGKTIDMLVDSANVEKA